MASIDNSLWVTARAAEEQKEVRINCYTGNMPPSLDRELHRLYGNIHSTLDHLRIYGGLDTVTHIYVARRGEQIIAIFLFRRERHVVRVINEGMAIDDIEIARFAHYVFSMDRAIDMIVFHAVQTRLVRQPTLRQPMLRQPRPVEQQLSFPHQRFTCTASMVLPLPASEQEYLATLGKNMRRNLRRYMDKLTRDFPSFRYEVFEGAAIDDQAVRDIIALNRARITSKQFAFAIDNEVEQIVALAAACGMVGIASIDGRICAGAVGYRVGDNYFFKIIGHDPQYNDYSLGILCCYQTIRACIERGCKEYNFMWNAYEYKYALGAAPRHLDHLVVYRSRLRMLRQGATALRAACDDYRYRASLLLEKAAKPESLSGGERLVLQCMNGLRSAKRLVRGVTASLRAHGKN